MDFEKDLRLIEAGFPCHQVGAETQRERGASSALPPLYFLHVWWARRPLTPSRAAILGSLLPADTDPGWFLRELGIEKRVATIHGQEWVLTGKVLDKIERDAQGEFLSSRICNPFLEDENARRRNCEETISKLVAAIPDLEKDSVLQRWRNESQQLPLSGLPEKIRICTVSADPAHVKERIVFAKRDDVKRVLGKEITWSPEDLYGYSRAFTHSPSVRMSDHLVLDLTSGGGSIPFEALRLGGRVIANELNPVAATILSATLQYPAEFGVDLAKDIERWGCVMLERVSQKMEGVTPFSPLPREELEALKRHCANCPELLPQFSGVEFDQTGVLYCRQVTCPHCGGDAPLLNTCWLAKGDGEKWGVALHTDGAPSGGTVSFAPYRLHKGKGPHGEDPSRSTVKGGVGQCIHCGHAIEAEEIKRQARGESPHGTWKDVLYTVAAVRYQPKLDSKGNPQRYKSGAKAGEIRTEKIRFFRAPTAQDLEALRKAEEELHRRWDEWEESGLIPTERFPEGNDMRPALYGMTRWCDMFTPRQLLGHLTLAEELNRLKPHILQELGEEKGKAVVTYLQFALDKGLDYNSRQTRWEYTRGIVKGTFGRHDFSLKWTFGEMIFTGPHSGAAWGLSQILDAYRGIAELVEPVHHATGGKPPVQIMHGTAANLQGVEDASVDLICFDPPYYNNVQYAELSDYFYVWQKRTLGDLYPSRYRSRLTNKNDEAVANPCRDGGSAGAKEAYERMMGEIFAEAMRVLKPEGIMTLMFTHKSQDAWETLTRSLIETGWIITSSTPVESETEQGIHTKDTASAVSSIFISCRKGTPRETPSLWSGFGDTGVQSQIREAVKGGLQEFEKLRLNAVDEMVGSYGRALRVLSQNWPVYDGEEQVSPVRAMNEASQVVAQHQMSRISRGVLTMEDLSSEAGMALTLFGIFGLGEFPFNEALNLSRSLGIALENRNGNYNPGEGSIGVSTHQSGNRARGNREDQRGYPAPLVQRGNKLRLALPEERFSLRMESPATEWDLLQGTLMAFREGDIPVARGYLERSAGEKLPLVVEMLKVWSESVGDEKLHQEAQALLFGLKP